MYIKFVLPALTEAHGKYWRSIKYSLFPPLGLATLAGYLNDSDEAKIIDEHVEKLDLEDEPDVVAIETYITSVFDATTEWAISQGIETATFHILTPYPGTNLFRRYSLSGRILHKNWDLYDTRHVVFSHPIMSSETLEHGYWKSYQSFYKWSSILVSAFNNLNLMDTLRHIAYVGAWKKFDPFWTFLIKLRRIDVAIPPLERVLKGSSRSFNDMLQQAQLNCAVKL